MKNIGLFAFLLAINLYGCVVPPVQQSGRDRDRNFQQFSLERSGSLNEWWSK